MGETASATRRLRRPVVLIGLMGAGKTSVGQRLAETLRVPFLDSDAEIERAAGMTIAEIFEQFGEAHFRDGERRVIRRLLEERPMVLATGGGAWMAAETREAIRDRAVSVWLKAGLDVLVARTAGRTHRPILNRGNPREILADLIAQRYPVYAEADLHVDSLLDQSHERMAGRIIAALEAHGRASGEPVLEDA
ncbi:MAG: shikimate kinase [Paracoccaceae bacterium]